MDTFWSQRVQITCSSTIVRVCVCVVCVLCVCDDIEILLHGYCHEQISQLLPIDSSNEKTHDIIMNSQLNDKIYNNSINYVCVYHNYCTNTASYCWSQLSLIL